MLFRSVAVAAAAAAAAVLLRRGGYGKVEGPEPRRQPAVPSRRRCLSPQVAASSAACAFSSPCSPGAAAAVHASQMGSSAGPDLLQAQGMRAPARVGSISVKCGPCHSALILPACLGSAVDLQSTCQ